MSSTVEERRGALIGAFVAAREAARLADPGEAADGGTCNFDSPLIRVRGARRAFIEACAGEAGLTVSLRSGRGPAWFFLGVPLLGQANRRTKMAEAATASLKASGLVELEAAMYYRMD